MEFVLDPGLLVGVLVKGLDRRVDLLILVIQREERLETRDACLLNSVLSCIVGPLFPLAFARYFSLDYPW